ncbi:MAG: hypothetical protein ACFFAT_04030 [Promethearchaeota archaeon]
MDKLNASKPEVKNAFKGIKEKMKEEKIDRLIFERKYLSEIFNKKILIFKKYDDLPVLNNMALDYFLFHWINVKYEGPLIKFIDIEKQKKEYVII